MSTPEELKQIHDFDHSMRKYYSNSVYSKIELANSCTVVLLQILSAILLFFHYQPTNPLIVLTIFILSYILTDFINGIAHMIMDNNTYYNSIFGPFITTFHLHHAKPKYQKRPPIQVYFFESGTKFWLSAYLLILVFLQIFLDLPFYLNFGLVSVGILSSIAELSHYWCHSASAQNTIILRLQKARILLCKKHHRIHHRFDNKQYAFLNGISDPLLNIISQHLYSGYKNHADKHTKAYLNNLKQAQYE